MLKRLFHINICVTDMERSVPFYQKLGFTKVSDFIIDDPGLGAVLGIKEMKKARGVFLRLGDDPNAPVIDMVQYLDPPTQGKAYPTLNNVGMCRVAFTVDDIDKVYEQLKAMKVNFVSPLVSLKGPGGAVIKAVCFKDPDGTVLELISGM